MPSTPEVTATDADPWATARVVMVDWSAAAGPTRGADSIWIGHGDDVEHVAAENVATRAAAVRRLAELCAVDRRVVIGLDASLGTPAGLAECFGHDGPDDGRWRTVWQAVTSEVHDADDNDNDRFEAAGRLNRRIGADGGPFWGHPHGRVIDHLAPTSPSWPVEVDGRRLAEHRAVERRLLDQGLRPQSTWKLAYQASVGSQFLTALGRIEQLHRLLDGDLAVWPFEDHDTARVVLAEVWPGRHDWAPGEGPRDRDQVVGVAAELLAWRHDGRLTAALEQRRSIPTAARSEEGWVLGVEA